MKRHGTAQWIGGLLDGKGVVSTESGVLDNTPYSFKTRFEQGNGTNPEELIAAAHAGCFSMAFSLLLEKEGFKAESIKTSAALSLEKSDAGFSIPAIHLDVKAHIPGIPEDKFKALALLAKESCPVSKLMNAVITIDLTLE